jgi:hypothetical protein
MAHPASPTSGVRWRRHRKSGDLWRGKDIGTLVVVNPSLLGMYGWLDSTHFHELMNLFGLPQESSEINLVLASILVESTILVILVLPQIDYSLQFINSSHSSV